MSRFDLHLAFVVHPHHWATIMELSHHRAILETHAEAKVQATIEACNAEWQKKIDSEKELFSRAVDRGSNEGVGDASGGKTRRRPDKGRGGCPEAGEV